MMVTVQEIENVVTSSKMHYSPFHIVQIMDFLEFLHEYCKEKSETCIEF